MITGTDDMSREAIEKQAMKFNVCPFELSLDAAVWTDAVICDYNYVFDPNAHLKRFFSEGSGGGYLFLIDEAHNLVERGREMYSAVLYKEDFLEVKRKVKGTARKLAVRLDAANRVFLELKRECESCRILESVSHLFVKLMNLMSEMEDFLEEAGEGETKDRVRDLYFQVRDFLNIYDILDDNWGYGRHDLWFDHQLSVRRCDQQNNLWNIYGKVDAHHNPERKADVPRDRNVLSPGIHDHPSCRRIQTRR